MEGEPVKLQVTAGASKWAAGSRQIIALVPVEMPGYRTACTACSALVHFCVAATSARVFCH